MFGIGSIRLRERERERAHKQKPKLWALDLGFGSKASNYWWVVVVVARKVKANPI